MKSKEKIEKLKLLYKKEYDNLFKSNKYFGLEYRALYDKICLLNWVLTGKFEL